MSSLLKPATSVIHEGWSGRKSPYNSKWCGSKLK